MASQPTPPPNVPRETRPNLGISNPWFPLDKAGYETLRSYVRGFNMRFIDESWTAAVAVRYGA